MMNEITYLDDTDATELAERIAAEQDKREAKLREMGAKTVEGITVEGKTFRSVINGED